MTLVNFVNVFTNGTTADGSQVEANFQRLRSVIEGNLNSGNLAADAVGASELQSDIVGEEHIDESTIFLFKPGMIMPYGGAITAFDDIAGWLWCNGKSDLNTTTYANLFAIVGYTYGGSGSSFSAPDLRGKFPIGILSTDTDFDALGETGGAKTHNHPSTNTGIGTSNAQIDPGAGGNSMATNIHTHALDLAAIDHMNPFLAINYLIKT